MNRLLTDEQYKECIPCYCDRCGMQLWMHVLFPRVAPDALIHQCVAKPPVVFHVEVIELKPYDYPVSKIFDLDHRFNDKDIL